MSDDLLADRYRLMEPIGVGGMAEVHRAWDTLLRRHVAVKLFQPGFDPAADRRFDNEVRTLAGLSHPGLVSVYDADTQGGKPFVVLQLVEGDTLRERIAAGPLSPDHVRRLGAGLADALAHVHAHGLVHRDVKPSNILLDADGTAYLADFGLVHLTGATRLTRTDQMVGTAAYLAPEQVLGEEISHQADVYALGLVLLECLTGHREYQGSDVEAAVARLHRPPAVPEDLPADIGELLSRMTATAPDDRPPAEECARALGALPLPFGDPPLSGILSDSTPAGSTPAPGALPPGDVSDSAPPDSAPPDSALPDSTVVLAVETTGTTGEGAPRSGSRPPWKTLVASAGALVGALAITSMALSGTTTPQTSSPGSSEPPTSAAQPVVATPESSAGTAGTADTPQDAAGPPGADTPRTTTEARAAVPAVPTTVAAEPAAGPGVDITTAPVATTTEQEVPTSAPPTTSESSPTTVDPVDPTTSSSEGTEG